MKKILSMTMVLMIFVATTFASTKTSIKTAELSKVITNEISKDYAGFTIKEAYKVDVTGIISYEVLIQKGSEQDNLFFDKDGKFIKKEFVSNTIAPKIGTSKPQAKTDSKK